MKPKQLTDEEYRAMCSCDTPDDARKLLKNLADAKGLPSLPSGFTHRNAETTCPHCSYIGRLVRNGYLCERTICSRCGCDVFQTLENQPVNKTYLETVVIPTLENQA